MLRHQSESVIQPETGLKEISVKVLTAVLQDANALFCEIGQVFCTEVLSCPFSLSDCLKLIYITPLLHLAWY